MNMFPGRSRPAILFPFPGNRATAAMTAAPAKAYERPHMDRRNPFWRSAEGEWAPRLVAMAIGIVVGLLILNYYYQKRIVPEELALGRGTMSAEASWKGTRLNAWRIPDYDKVYPAASPGSGPADEALWLGNSQLHAVNQFKDGDTTAPAFASEALSRRVYALSLPNANLQEHLVVTAWALHRRSPRWLVVPVVFDDMREDGLRPDFKSIDGPELRAALKPAADGTEVLAELDKLSAAEKESQGTEHAAKSLQVIVEAALEGWLARRWDVWAKREDIYSTFLATEVYQLRNRIFGITAKTKRPLIPLRYEKNMDALRALLRAAGAAKVRVLVYIPPLRWDVDPPYFLDQYETCKADVRRAAAESGAWFVDLDRTVPTEFWGERYGDIDFMHFQEGGHRLMGEAIAAAIRRAESGELAPASAAPATGGKN